MIIKRNSTGANVLKWQQFLASKGYQIGGLDGIFGGKVEAATRDWQKVNGLIVDGIVGSGSWAKAGLAISTTDLDYYPPRPTFTSPSQMKVKELFGSFEWKPKGASEIIILGDWAKENITKVIVPQLKGIPFAPADGGIYFHKKGIKQLLGAFAEVEASGLLDRIISFSGAYYPRRIRGRQALSNHSWGSAFDINAPENWLGREPARIGEKGCLLELVPIFNKFGFYWGGHYANRRDGMHFEIAKLM